jgi:protein CpxP
MTHPTLLRHSAAWLVAATLSSASLSLWAQTAAPAATPPAGAHPMHGQMMPGMKARHEQHLQALKAKLQLSAEQEPAWTTFASAMAMPAQRPARPDWKEIANLSTPERIDRMKALRQQRQTEMNAQMDRRGEASKAFYASLNAEQKKTFDDETRKHMAQRGEHGTHGHHGRHGRG